MEKLRSREVMTFQIDDHKAQAISMPVVALILGPFASQWQTNALGFEVV